MKFISWNVNGLRACVQKGFLDFFNSIDADFFCIQESKLQAGQIDLDLPGYHQYWNYAEKKGYSGTAIFAKNIIKLCFKCIFHHAWLYCLHRTGMCFSTNI